MRSDDLFVGGWVDPGKVAIPQADEQQRLLANLITRMTTTPLPRFWYLPRGERATVVLTGDDHGNGGTRGAFARLRAASRPGCSVADWQCVRATSYVYPSTPISPAQARAYEAEGFELALHVSTGCRDATTQSLENAFATQLLVWLDARNGSSFAGVRFARRTLRFAIRRAPHARGLQAMVPLRASTDTLQTLRRDGRRIAFARRRVKGVAYAVFSARAGRYVARYG